MMPHDLTECCFCHNQAVLMQSREQVAEELSRLQRDNDSLTGKHRLHLSLQQQEDFKLPTMVQVRDNHSQPLF